MSPLPLLSAVLVIGVATARWCPLDRLPILAAAGLAILIYGLSIYCERQISSAVACLVASWLLGWSIGARDSWDEPLYKPREHILQARVEELRPSRGDRSRLELLLQGAAILGKEGEVNPLHPARGRLQVWSDAPLPPELARGDAILLRVGPPRRRESRNFGDGGVFLHRPSQASLLAGPLLVKRGPWWNRGLTRLRGHLRRGVDLAVDSPARGLVLALSLGDRSALNEVDLLAFRRSGTAHLLAVSGLHVSLIGGFLYWLATIILVRTPLAQRVLIARPAAVVAIVGCWFYALLTGLGPSAFRAAVMLTFSHAATVAGRPAGSKRAICIAAAVLLIDDPTLIWSAGFQLSFIAVLALTGLERGPGTETLDEEDGQSSLFSRVVRGIRQIVETSAVATGATAPLLLHHFGQVSCWGVLVNVVAVPLTGLVVLPGSLSITAIAGLSDVLGRWLGHIVAPLLNLFLSGLRCAGSLPSLLPSLARPNLVEAMVFSTSVLLLARRGKRKWGVLMLVAACLIWTVRLELPRIRGSLEITFLDVGAGDATLVRLPDGSRWLVDSGPRRGTPTWTPPVVAAVQRSGFGRLDLLALTHGHLDHAAGVPALLERIGSKRFWFPATSGNRESELLLTLAGERGIPVNQGLDCGSTRLPGEVLLEVLHPCGDEDAQMSENDRSLVIRLTYGQVSVLLPGDIERVAESALVRRSRDLQATVLKLPHHGSSSSSSDELLDAVRPKVAIGSCARSRRRPLPDAAVTARLRERGILVLSTAELGAIRLSTNGRRIRFDSARTGSLDLPLSR